MGPAAWSTGSGFSLGRDSAPPRACRGYSAGPMAIRPQPRAPGRQAPPRAPVETTGRGGRSSPMGADCLGKVFPLRVPPACRTGPPAPPESPAPPPLSGPFSRARFSSQVREQRGQIEIQRERGGRRRPRSRVRKGRRGRAASCCGAIRAGRDAGKGNASTPAEMQIAIQNFGRAFSISCCAARRRENAARPACKKLPRAGSLPSSPHRTRRAIFQHFGWLSLFRSQACSIHAAWIPDRHGGQRPSGPHGIARPAGQQCRQCLHRRYKADREFYSLYAAAGSASDDPPATMPVIERPWTDLPQGVVHSTGNPLDVALSGNGFFPSMGRADALHAQRQFSPGRRRPTGHRRRLCRAGAGRRVDLQARARVEILPATARSAGGAVVGPARSRRFHRRGRAGEAGRNYFRQGDPSVRRPPLPEPPSSRASWRLPTPATPKRPCGW